MLRAEWQINKKVQEKKKNRKLGTIYVVFILFLSDNWSGLSDGRLNKFNSATSLVPRSVHIY